MTKRFLTALLLVIYSLILIKIMVFKDVPGIRVGQVMLNFGGTAEGQPNFLPFTTILPYLIGENGFIIGGLNLGGNIALLVPIGLLLPLVLKNLAWKKNLIVAAASGFIIEISQVVLRVGIFDIDDVILNALGVMIGYWIYMFFAKWIQAKNYKAIIIVLIACAVACLGVGYVVMSDLSSQKRVVRPDIRVEKSQEGEMPEGDDLCGGTGGTGKIVGKEQGSILLRRNDNVVQAIKLTDKTIIKTQKGTISESELNEGERVTVVIDDSETASVVLICAKP